MRIVEAVDAERARLAREVHDGPAQVLANAVFRVESAERALDEDGAAARVELQSLGLLLRRQLDEVRAFMGQLRPRGIDERGLNGAIREVIADVVALTDTEIRTDLRAPDRGLGAAEQTVALRIVQEALQNVRRHAAARYATISTRVDGETWILEVRDDGRGFDLRNVSVDGRRRFGLQFMRERAELVGAHLDVRSRPSGGTTVALAIPLQKENR
jgi:two-component system sensor histidine kinase DegS